MMTEEEAKNNNEMKMIMILSGFLREVSESNDIEKLIYKYAKWIDNIYTKN